MNRVANLVAIVSARLNVCEIDICLQLLFWEIGRVPCPCPG